MDTLSIRSRTPTRGSTLVIVALLMAAVAMLSLSFLTVLRSSQKENQGSRESLSALYACEAGLTAAVENLARGGTGTLGTENAPVSLGDQRYWVQATDIGDGRIALLSYGRDDSAKMGVELVVQPSSRGFFRWAAFGDESLQLAGDSSADSFDSADGDYASQQVNGSGPTAYANSDGQVGSNGNITMDSSVGVWGDAHPGSAGTLFLTGSGNISGSSTPLATTLELPDIVLPVVPTSGSLLVSSSQTLASGFYHYDALQVNGNKTLTIIGPAKSVCDDFKLEASSEILVNAADGPVEFYVLGDFLLNSDTSIASLAGNPADVAFNLLSDNILDPGIDLDFDEDEVDIDAGSSLIGTIYAPSAAVTIDSNFELFGALVARQVTLDANCRIHYDEALATASDEASAAYETLCWRLVSQP